MELAGRVSEILSDAERKLADLAAEAFQQRDYSAVNWLTSIAQRISEVRAPAGSPSAMFSLLLKDGDAPAPSVILAERSPAAPPHTQGDSTSEAKDYPRFYRDQNQLVKIG